jgi:L-threonylcarbamoyladenylate synthase
MKRVILSNTSKKQILNKSREILRNGGLVVYPTETCYGIGVDATNKKAVEKLLRYKERPEGKAISIAVSDEQMADKYVVINETAKNLYTNFLPGPITVISDSKHVVCKEIQAEDGSLGVRIPDYQFARELITAFGKPITATSANISGRKTPYKIEDILNNIPEKKKELIDFIIDAGELPHNPPSTVVDTRLNDANVLRQGSFSINNKKQILTSHSEEETRLISEDMMINHLLFLKEHAIIFALQGELGAGKTQFAKGVAYALGINENVSSPTFTIVKEYSFPQTKVFVKNQILKGTLYHIDTWRMHEKKELLDLGFEKMVRPGNVIVIEWAEKVIQLIKSVVMKNKAISIFLDINGESEESQRVITYFSINK